MMMCDMLLTICILKMVVIIEKYNKLKEDLRKAMYK